MGQGEPALAQKLGTVADADEAGNPACEEPPAWKTLSHRLRVGRSMAGVGRSGFAMLKWALIFFVISLIAGALGFAGVSAATGRIAKILQTVWKLWLKGSGLRLGSGSLPPIIFPGRPERWWGDEALKAETDAPQATLEQRHQAAGDVLALRCRGFFS